MLPSLTGICASGERSLLDAAKFLGAHRVEQADFVSFA
jgi:hypothetical protein